MNTPALSPKALSILAAAAQLLSQQADCSLLYALDLAVSAERAGCAMLDDLCELFAPDSYYLEGPAAHRLAREALERSLDRAAGAQS